MSVEEIKQELKIVPKDKYPDDKQVLINILLVEMSTDFEFTEKYATKMKDDVFEFLNKRAAEEPTKEPNKKAEEHTKK